MPIRYSNHEIIDKIEKIIRKKRLFLLYKEPYIKRKGKTKESEFYSEVASRILLDKNIKRLLSGQVKEIPRKNYKVAHTGKYNKHSPRVEEILAISLKNRNLRHLGRILEYQIPLKSKRANSGVGKIDLVSINTNANQSFIIELKARNNIEGLLKAVLEIATYEHQLNKDSFRIDMNIPEGAIILKAVLLENGSQSYNEARELSERPNLCNLIKHLKISIFLLEDRNDLTIRSVNL